MQWDTAGYYTLSTIAQTLAGGLGLLAAFVIIRATALAQSIRSDADQIYREVGGHREHTDAYLGGDFTGLVASYRAAHEQAVATGAEWPKLNTRQLAILQHAERAIVSKTGLLKEVGRALTLSVAVMGFSILVLPLTPIVSGIPVLLAIVLGAGVLGAIGSLAWYVRIVRATLSD